MPEALARAVPSLRCPVCAGALELQRPTTGPPVLACGFGHRFDVARQGHVVLRRGATRLRSDTAEMVAARDRVLASGAFDPVSEALARAVAAVAPEGLLVDLGAGTGQHTAAVLDAVPGLDGVAVELSTPALRRAARAHPRLAAVGADVTGGLPLAGGAAAAVVAVFAPLPPTEELLRVTAPRAGLVVVTPTPDHLAQLRSRLDLLAVPGGKPERLATRLALGWRATATTVARRQVSLDRALARDVVAMGPNAWHLDQALADALDALPERVEDTVAVTFSSFVRD